MMDFKIILLKRFKNNLLSSNQLIGNGLVLPSGPLRESLNTLKNAQIVLINGNKDIFLKIKY